MLWDNDQWRRSKICTDWHSKQPIRRLRPRERLTHQSRLIFTVYSSATSQITISPSHHMPRIYITQKEFDNISCDKKTETHIIQEYQWDLTKKSYPYTIVWNKKTLTCSVCWTKTKWRQWYNRDKWFGICQACYQEDFQHAMADDLADLRSSYGIYWVHFGKLSDFLLQE